MLPHSSGELLLLGTEGGHVFIVEVPGFREVEERNISLDQVASRLVTTNETELEIYTRRFITADKSSSWLSCLLQCTRRLHRPQESGTRRGLTGEPSRPRPGRYWLWTRSHDHMGSGETLCHAAHPCHTGTCSFRCKWLKWNPCYSWGISAIIFHICYVCFHCNHSNLRVCGGRMMEATFSVRTVMEVIVSGSWAERMWMRKRRNPTFHMVRRKNRPQHSLL